MLRTAGRRSALFLLVALLVPGIATAVAPAPVPAGQPAAADKEWPRTIRLGEAKLVLDAPRAESLEGTVLKARGGAQLERPGKPEPLVGTVWYQAEIAVDRSHRTVTLVSVQIPRVQLAGVPPARAQQIATKLGEQLTRAGWKLSLDEVLASARLASRHDEVPAKLGTAPPKILFAMSPTGLVLFDGEPKFRAVPDTGLERAMNTAFLVLRDPKANLCYLDGGTGWFRADTPTGPWEKAGSVPDDAKQIARKDRQEAGIPETAVDEAAKGSGKQEVRFLVSNEPAELIVSDGPPKWTPLVEGELETIANSENDLFRTTKDGNLWIVLSGRWYRASSPEGPWSYVEADRVPPPFRLIPADSPKASVLAFIPGTAPAREAIKDASTPRTAAVRRSDAHVTVTYDGEPKFEGIPGTHVEYALNTAEEVLKVRGRYYV